MLGKSLMGVGISLAWLCIIIVKSLVSTHSVSLFPIISLLMLVTQTAGGMLAPVHRIFLLTPSWDNGFLGLIFIGSLLTSRPLVLSLVDKETISPLSAKYGRSAYYLKAWERITVVWGLFYVFQGILLSATCLAHSSFGKALDILFSWPSVLLLLYFSVDYPRHYWEKHAAAMQWEIKQAESE